MKKSGTKGKKLRWLLPAVIFILGILIWSGVVYQSRINNQMRVREIATLNAVTYAERMADELREGTGMTNALEKVVISANGKIDKFQEIVKGMMTDSIQSIQLAPDGIVTEIYPEEGNEFGKINLLQDEKRGEVARYARDHDMLIMQGPFPLKQGELGIAIRNPVYIQQENGDEVFWGFTIAIIRVPEIFSDSVAALGSFGYEYALYKTASPLSQEYEEIYSSGKELTNPVSYGFELGGCSWKLEVMPVEGWNQGAHTTALFLAGFLVVLLLTGLTAALLALEQRRRNFKRLATTDPLTGLLNRSGFEEQVNRYLEKYPEEHCVGMEMDIDDFKFINDMYGHSIGDKAIQRMAETMKETFPHDAILGRSGGDEFRIILKHTTNEQAREKIEQFTRMTRTFFCGDEAHPFYISLGYAEYPVQGESPMRLIRCADRALYEVKLRGKHGCQAYENNFQVARRSQLGFALKDISEHLPGAFLIYKADRADDSLLFANKEMIQLAGCKDMDDFWEFTEHRFRNLIHPEEQQAVEQSIWEQIQSGVEGNNDYVQFRLAQKDGSYKKVLDHGRIVGNSYFGKVFYVLLTDWKFLQRHYIDNGLESLE